MDLPSHLAGNSPITPRAHRLQYPCPPGHPLFPTLSALIRTPLAAFLPHHSEQRKHRLTSSRDPHFLPAFARSDRPIPTYPLAIRPTHGPLCLLS